MVQYLAWEYLNVQPEDQRIKPPTFWLVNNLLYLLSHGCHKYDSCGDKCGKNKKCSNNKKAILFTWNVFTSIKFSALRLELEFGFKWKWKSFFVWEVKHDIYFRFWRWRNFFLKITVFNSEKCQNIVEIPIFPGPRSKDSLNTYSCCKLVSSVSCADGLTDRNCWCFHYKHRNFGLPGGDFQACGRGETTRNVAHEHCCSGHQNQSWAILSALQGQTRITRQDELGLAG